MSNAVGFFFFPEKKHSYSHQSNDALSSCWVIAFKIEIVPLAMSSLPSNHFSLIVSLVNHVLYVIFFPFSKTEYVFLR